MYKLLKLENLDDYFKVKSQRNEIGIFFYRIIGYDDELLQFLRKYQIFTQKKGTYVKDKITNPDPSDIDYLCKLINNEIEVSKEKIKNVCKIWLEFLNESQTRLISEALYEILHEMVSENINKNIIKNAYIKFLYWLKYKFENCIKYIAQDEVPKVLYEGNIGKYELYMLRILSLAGCDVLYINFLNEEQYMKYDNIGKKSIRIIKPIRQNPPIHFSKIDIKQIDERKKYIEELTRKYYNIVTNDWMKNDFFEEVFNNDRNKNIIENIFVNYIGIDKKDEYNNRLYKFKIKLENEGKNYCIIENGIPNPTLEEIEKYRFQYKSKEDIAFELIKRININNDEKISKEIKKVIYEVINNINETNLTKIYNFTLKIVCWIERYTKVLFKKFNLVKMPILIYFGNCDIAEATFLSTMSRLPIDVIYINPNKENSAIFNKSLIKNNIKKIELQNNYSEKMNYPKNEIKISQSTIAYNAEKELDNILYKDTGLFRNKQFNTCKNVTLKTTFEEIEILWNTEAQYRTGFKVEENLVNIPNLFAKISGINQNDTYNYFKDIQNMMTDKTILIKGFPHIKKDTYNVFYASSNKFITNDKINNEEIKKFKEYKYTFLNNNTQEFILSKIQELISLKLLEQNDLSINQKIVATLLNLDKNILNIIQQFDFTKDIPKVIIIDVDENIASLYDCILILFFNIIGFDIIIYTPTGYQNIEKYIKSALFEEYQIGNYVYDLVIPQIKKTDKTKTKFLKSLFKRRK